MTRARAGGGGKGRRGGATSAGAEGGGGRGGEGGAKLSDRATAIEGETEAFLAAAEFAEICTTLRKGEAELSLGEAELRLVGQAGRLGKDGEARLLGDVTRLSEGEEEELEGSRRSEREEMAE